MTDFQKTSYPLIVNPRKNDRNVFTGFGTHGNVAITEDHQRDIVSQYVPQGFLKETQRFCASRPTLPLFNDPELNIYPFKDLIRGGANEKEERVFEILKKIKHIRDRYNLQCFSRKLDEISYVLNQLEISGSKRHYSKCMRTRLKKLTHSHIDKLTGMYTEIKDTQELYKINMSHTGGSLVHTCEDTEMGRCVRGSVLLSSHGPEVSHIKISSYKEHDTGWLNGTVRGTHDFGEEVRELCAGPSKNKDLLLVRGKSKCALLRLKSLEDATGLEMVEVFRFENDEIPTSVCISPYLAHESILTTTDGNVYLWKPEKRKEAILTGIHHRFQSYCPWRQAVFGSHPRQIVLADRTAVQMFDMRQRMREGTDLFALPNRLLNPDERVHVIMQHPVLHHAFILATDYSMFFVDERFPGNPLLSWHLTLSLPPTYLSCLPSRHNDACDIITVASQLPEDVCCYAVRSGLSETPQALGSPWRISTIDDFIKWPQICSGPSRIIAEDRFNTSLAGITTVHTSNGFCVFQMDSYGELFYQVYEETTERCDRSFSAGPGSHKLNIDRVIPIGQEWLSKVSNFVKQKRDTNNAIGSSNNDGGHSDSSFNLNDILHQSPHHIKCELCSQSQQCGDDDNNSEADLFDDCDARNTVEDEDLCYCCGQKISTGAHIRKERKELPAKSYTYPDLTDVTMVMTPVDDLPAKGALSQILKKLWEEDYDLHELLLKRDEEILSRKKVKKRKFVGADSEVDNQKSRKKKTLLLQTDAPDNILAHDSPCGSVDIVLPITSENIDTNLASQSEISENTTAAVDMQPQVSGPSHTTYTAAVDVQLQVSGPSHTTTAVDLQPQVSGPSHTATAVDLQPQISGPSHTTAAVDLQPHVSGPLHTDGIQVPHADADLRPGETFREEEHETRDIDHSNTDSALLLNIPHSPNKGRRRHSSSSSSFSKLSDLSVISNKFDGFKSTPAKFRKYKQSDGKGSERIRSSSKSESESDLFGDMNDSEQFSLLTASQEKFRSPVNLPGFSRQSGSPKKKRKFVSGF